MVFADPQELKNFLQMSDKRYVCQGNNRLSVLGPDGEVITFIGKFNIMTPSDIDKYLDERLKPISIRAYEKDLDENTTYVLATEFMHRVVHEFYREWLNSNSFKDTPTMCMMYLRHVSQTLSDDDNLNTAVRMRVYESLSVLMKEQQARLSKSFWVGL